MSQRTVVGLAVLGVGLVAIASLLVVRSFVYIPVIYDDAPAIYDAASLPDSLHVCGRTWHRSQLGVQSKAQLTALSDTAPVVVTPRQFAAYPKGACTAVAGGSCATVIFARVGEDAYASYSLGGGP